MAFGILFLLVSVSDTSDKNPSLLLKMDQIPDIVIVKSQGEQDIVSQLQDRVAITFGQLITENDRSTLMNWLHS